MPLLVFAEQWRLHPTFDGKIERIIDTPEYTYFLSRCQPFIENAGDNTNTYFHLFRTDKDAEEIEFLCRQNLLSENIIHCAEYNFDKNYLLIVYDNGNIDLVYDDGKVVNIPGLKLANSGYEKKVNGISFYADANEIYLATEFGYILIDDAAGEIVRTYNFGVPLVSAFRIDDHVVLGNSEGLRYADRSAMTFDEYQPLGEFSNIKRSARLAKDKMLVWMNSGWDGLVYCVQTDSTGSLSTQWIYNTFIKSLEPCKEGVLLTGYFDIFKIKEDLSTLHFGKAEEDYNDIIGGWSGNSFWINKDRYGLVRKTFSADRGWIVEMEKLYPNAANAFKSDNMVYHPVYGMLVRNHGINHNFTTQWEYTTDLIASLKGLTWTPMSAAYRAPNAAFEQWNPNGIAVDPANTSHIYSGSYTHGIMRLDLEVPSKSLRLGRVGDSANGLAGFIPVVKDQSYALSCSFSSPLFDNNGTMWVAWFDYDVNKEAREKEQTPTGDDVEFWYWAKDNRLASNNAASFKPMTKWRIKNLVGSASQKIIPLHSPSYRNILMYYSGSWGGALVFIDHKGTLDNQNDDERVDIKEFTDQDGLKVEFAYIMSVYEDTANGLVWLGLDNGVLNFRPSEIMKTGGRVNRIKVSRNDGTNLADYLLDGVSVNCIIPDNSGRKWFGTGGGGIVVTSGDGTEVLRTYTTDNSELPDNTVYSICYNPENNSMMISTDKGLAELFLSTSAGGDSDNKALIYPNPVRPDYFGYVTIEGVADNALVKIVDAGGNLIKEVGFAAGGEARWDVTNLNSKRVPGGVYYVLVSGAPDGESFSTAGKVLVVN